MQMNPKKIEYWLATLLERVNLWIFQSELKIIFLFKFVEFLCHKVDKNGLNSEVVYPITYVVKNKAHPSISNLLQQ